MPILSAPPVSRSAPVTSKQIAKYTAEVSRTLTTLENTPQQDWAAQSTVLTYLLRLLDTHKEVLGATPLPVPLRFCRALWRALGPHSVLGVQRKALDVLTHYVEYAAPRDVNEDISNSLLVDFPYLLVGALDLFPVCSLQLKPDLLQFMENLLRALFPQQVRQCMYGVMSTVLQGMEGWEGSGVFQRAAALLRYLREKVSRASPTSAAPDGEDGTSCSPHLPTALPAAAASATTAALTGGEAFFATLWLILRDCPGLRSPTLLFLKTALAEEEAELLAKGTYRPAAAGHSDGFKGVTGVLEEDLARQTREWLGGAGGPCTLVHPALMLCLQDRNGKTQRLTLDLLVTYFPLEVHPVEQEAVHGQLKIYLSASFSFMELALMAAAALQLLGLPGETTGVLRRVVAWLCGPHPELTAQYVQRTTGYIIAQSFCAVEQWWGDRYFVEAAERFTSAARHLATADDSSRSPPEAATAASLDALSVSASHTLWQALEQSRCGMNVAAAKDDHFALLVKCERPLQEFEVAAYVWWGAILRLLQYTAVSGDDDEGCPAVSSMHSPTIAHLGSAPLSLAGNPMEPALASSAPVLMNGNAPFLAYVAPLLVTSLFDWIVRLGVLQFESQQSGGRVSLTINPLDAILGQLFATVPWSHMAQYEAALLRLIEKVSKQLLQTSGDTSGREPPYNGDDVRRRTQRCLAQLRGFAEVLLEHLLPHVRHERRKAEEHFDESLDNCHSIAALAHTAVVILCKDWDRSTEPSLAILEQSDIALGLLDELLQLYNLRALGLLCGLHERLRVSLTEAAVGERHLTDAALADRLEKDFLRPFFIPMLELLLGSIGPQQDVLSATRLEALAKVYNEAVATVLWLEQLCSRARGDGVGFGGQQWPAKANCSSGTKRLAKWLAACGAVAPTRSPPATVALTKMLLPQKGVGCYPEALNAVLDTQTLAHPLVQRLWTLLHSSGAHPQGGDQESEDLSATAANVLYQLLIIPACKKAADALMLDASRTNSERLVVFLEYAAHHDGATCVHRTFFTGYCTLLEALTHPTAAAHSSALQYVAGRDPSELFTPLLESVLRGVNLSDPPTAVPRDDDLCAVRRLLRRDADLCYEFVDPVSFCELIRAILETPGAQECARAAAALPVPCVLTGILSKIEKLCPGGASANSPLKAVAWQRRSGDGDDADIPYTSLLGTLVGTLLFIPRQSMTSTPLSYGSHSGGEDGAEPNVHVLPAFRCLNTLLFYTQSDPYVSTGTVLTWQYTSVRCVPLLQTAVQMDMLAAQVVLLTHLEGATRLLREATDRAGYAEDCDRATHPYHPLPRELKRRVSTSGESADPRDASCHITDKLKQPAPAALQMPLLYRTVEDGVQRCLRNPHGEVRLQLLRAWLNFLVSTLTVLSAELVAASDTILHVLLLVLEGRRSDDRGDHKCLPPPLLLELQELCEDTVGRVIVYLYAVAEALDTEQSTAAQQERESMGWIRQAFATSASRLDGSLWQRSPVCQPIRDLLTRIVGQAIPPVGSRPVLRPSAARLLRLLYEQAGVEVVRTYVHLWKGQWAVSEQFIRGNPPAVLASRARSESTNNTPARQQPMKGQAHASTSEPSAYSVLSYGLGDTTTANGALAWYREQHTDNSTYDAEAAAYLLLHGTGATYQEIVASMEAMMQQSGDASSLSESQSATSTALAAAPRASHGRPLSTESLAVFFLHSLVAALMRRQELRVEDIDATVELFSRLYTTRAPSYLSIAVIHHSLSQMQQFAASGPGRVYFADKRFSFVVYRTLECLGSIPLFNSPDLENHVFAFTVVAAQMPYLASSFASLDASHRIGDAASLLFSRSCLPTLKHGIESSSEADVVGRTPTVLASLRMAQSIVNLAASLAKRLRSDVEEMIVSESFFRVPRAVLHEWTLLVECMTRDRIFVTLLLERCTTPVNKLVSIITPFATEGSQRARQLKSLAFVTLALPAAIVNERDFMTMAKEQISAAIAAYSSTIVPSVADLTQQRVLLQPIRMVLLWVRVLLTKLSDASISTLWPIVVPEMMRAMGIDCDTMDTDLESIGDAALSKQDRVERKNRVLKVRSQMEVFALQAEVLKLVDFAITICPEQFTVFRWLFGNDTIGVDPAEATGNTPQQPWPPFLVSRLPPNGAGYTPNVLGHPACSSVPDGLTLIAPFHGTVVTSAEPSVFGTAGPTHAQECTPNPWRGYTRPFFSIPETHYPKIHSITVLSQALRNHYTVVHVEPSTAREGMGLLRGSDYWDREYIRALLETDMSLVDPDISL